MKFWVGRASHVCDRVSSSFSEYEAGYSPQWLFLYSKILGEGRTGEVRTLNFVCLAFTRIQAKNVSRYGGIIFRSKETTPRMHACMEGKTEGWGSTRILSLKGGGRDQLGQVAVRFAW